MDPLPGNSQMQNGLPLRRKTSLAQNSLKRTVEKLVSYVIKARRGDYRRNTNTHLLI